MEAVMEDVFHSLSGIGFGEVDLYLIQILNLLKKLCEGVCDISSPGNRNVHAGALFLSQAGLPLQTFQFIHDFFCRLQELPSFFRHCGSGWPSLKYRIAKYVL